MQVLNHQLCMTISETYSNLKLQQHHMQGQMEDLQRYILTSDAFHFSER